MIAGVFTSQLPGLAFFMDLAPPLFPAITLLASGAGLSAFALGYRRTRDHVRLAARAVVLAVLCAALYAVLLSQWSVAPPPERDRGERFQIGFGLMAFSLTSEARVKTAQMSLRTPEELMLAFGGYEQQGTALIWRTWTIVAAGTLLIATYVLSFLTWCYGLGLLARGLPPELLPAASDRKTRGQKVGTASS
jgi:hypothetical protein